MTPLHDRLADLAEEAPPGGPLPDLWQQGRRIAFVRRVGTAGVVAASCLALLVVVGLAWERGRPTAVAPAGGTHEPAMPDRLHRPSGWLGSFDGAPGPLAAVIPTRHQHLVGSEPGVVGVSATTGRYAFLVLPRFVADGDGDGGVALSPDGRRLAYWISGSTSGDPVDDEPVTGYAVYDAVTGRTSRVEIPTRRGLDSAYSGNLAWLDDRTLLVQYGQKLTANESRTERPVLWRVGGSVRPVGERSGPSWTQYAGGHSWLLQVEPGSWRWALTNTASDGLRAMRMPNIAFRSDVAISPDGTHVAGVGTSETGVLKIVGPDGDVAADGDAKTFSAFYWLDDHQVLASRRVSPDIGADTALESLDVATHRWTRLVRGLPPYEQSQLYAFELLDRPTRPAEEPPHPLGARVVTGSAIAILLVGGLALVVWRRRARP